LLLEAVQGRATVKFLKVVEQPLTAEVSIQVQTAQAQELAISAVVAVLVSAQLEPMVSTDKGVTPS
jgi:hypothetical protein